VTIRLVCKPYWRGIEVTGSTASSSTPFVTQTVSYTTGDVPALGRLIVTDTATQSRRHVEWGLENRHYNASTSLLIDSDDMVTSGFGGTTGTLSGAYDPNASGNSIISGNFVGTAASALVGTGNLSHVGSFRVKGRVTSNVDASVGIHARFVWQVADGPFAANDWVTLRYGDLAWEEVDFGAITISSVLSGTQRWTGRIEYKTDGFSGAFYVDYLTLIPTGEGYGKARIARNSLAGVVVDYDQFASTTATSALNGTTSDSGDVWATSGDATDFTFTDDLSGENIKRATTADATNGRYAVLGTATPTNVMVQSLIYHTASPSGASQEATSGVIARWTDSSNYVRGVLGRSYTGSVNQQLMLQVIVAGTAVLDERVSVPVNYGINTWYQINLVAYTSGRMVLQLLDSSGGLVIATTEGTATQVATGGALASGKSGIYDYSDSAATTVTRYYDDFVTATPEAEPIVLYSGRNMQVRHDDVIRQDSTGTYMGRPPSYRGSRFVVPTGTSRVLVKARRNDIEAMPDSNVTDATQIQIAYTPRGLAVPRS
jgi:hypothetical protein